MSLIPSFNQAIASLIRFLGLLLHPSGSALVDFRRSPDDLFPPIGCFVALIMNIDILRLCYTRESVRDRSLSDADGGKVERLLKRQVWPAARRNLIVPNFEFLAYHAYQFLFLISVSVSTPYLPR